MEPARDEKGRLLPGHTANPNGRPKKKTFRDYFDENEELALINKIKQALDERPEILKMAVEQIFGKPKQQIEQDITSGGKTIMLMPSELIEKHEVPSETSRDSE